MNIYISSFKKGAFFFLLLITSKLSPAQNDSSYFKRITVDSAVTMDAAYSRPFLNIGKLPLAIGGYMETNTQYAVTDGVSDGFSFQFRRFTLFISSPIARKIKFLGELELEDGAKEINLEYAAVDMEFHPLVNLRAGIIVNPVGAFNQNHDGPKWDFVDRPLAATTIIPSTLSNAGAGLFGKYFLQQWIVGYEAYLTNGFDDRIISNEHNRTSLASGKSSPEKFEESNSGLPMFSGKLTVRQRKLGELGFSYMSGIYNKWREDGLVIDDKRNATVVALDLSTSFFENRVSLISEFSKVLVEVPETYSQAFATKQAGGFVDIVTAIVQRPILGWEKAKVNFALRFDYADYNQETFKETGSKIGDEHWAVSAGIALRPTGGTVLRFNYRYDEQQDLLGNPPAKTGTVQLGLATYF